MRTIVLSTAALAAALVAAGCATIHVGSYVARDVALAQYRTYEWGPADALPTGDPRLDSNAFFHDRFQGGVEKALAAKGLRPAAAGDAPDLLIHYHASVSWRSEIDALDRALVTCSTPDCTPRVQIYELGTIVVDVIDPRSRRMVWRGWAEDRFDGALDTQQALERTIDDAVRELMKACPLGTGAS